MAHCRGGCSPTPELRFRQVPGASVGGEGGEGGWRFPATPRVSTRGPCTECSSFRGHPPTPFQPRHLGRADGICWCLFPKPRIAGPEAGSSCVWKIHASFICSGDTRQLAFRSLENTNQKKEEKKERKNSLRQALPRKRIQVLLEGQEVLWGRGGTRRQSWLWLWGAEEGPGRGPFVCGEGTPREPQPACPAEPSSTVSPGGWRGVRGPGPRLTPGRSSWW